jgi:putative glutamine amidotransferase
MKKPIIGIVLDLPKNAKKYFYSPKPWYALRADYSNILEKFGALPVLLPYTNDIESQIDIIDGLLIPGADEDINPKFYGQKIKSSRVKTNDTRALYELALVKEVLKRDIPVFGICNGLQILNVSLGGTLIQNIPDVHKSNINHEQPYPTCSPTHDIIINDGSLLSRLTKEKRVKVNTTHHQAIDEIADSLVVAASATDGIIEEVESKDHKFLIGVQWHSEYQNSELDKNLFKRFIEESTSSSHSTT